VEHHQGELFPGIRLIVAGRILPSQAGGGSVSNSPIRSRMQAWTSPVKVFCQAHGSVTVVHGPSSHTQIVICNPPENSHLRFRDFELYGPPTGRALHSPFSHPSLGKPRPPQRLSLGENRAAQGKRVVSERHQRGTIANVRGKSASAVCRPDVHFYLARLRSYCSLAYSALASFGMGMSGSASFQSARKS
jgi:hypothetical protein